MSEVWTPEQVARIAAVEKERAYYLKYQKEAPRLMAISIVREAFIDADRRYRAMYDEVQEELNVGLIGPPGQPHRSDRHVWVAGEVRKRLIAELNDESPISEEEEM